MTNPTNEVNRALKLFYFLLANLYKPNWGLVIWNHSTSCQHNKGVSLLLGAEHLLFSSLWVLPHLKSSFVRVFTRSD